jgi:hypothetical protein
MVSGSWVTEWSMGRTSHVTQAHPRDPVFRLQDFALGESVARRLHAGRWPEADSPHKCVQYYQK